MDDGDLQGNDNLIRIRTSKGHQITMSDDGNCFYICHANGQAWVEMGQEGTLDVYATNSINLRTQGTLNLHADQDINMFSGGNLNIKSTNATTIQSDSDLSLSNKGQLSLFSQGGIGIKAIGTLAISSQLGSWAASSTLSFNGDQIQLNGGPAIDVATPAGLTTYIQPNTEFNSTTGWVISPTGTESIVTRAPTHEPYPYHNMGIANSVNLGDGSNSTPPNAPPIPEGVTITKTGDAETTAAAAVSAPANNTQSLATQKAQYQSLNNEIHTLTDELITLQKSGGNSGSIIGFQNRILDLSKQQDVIVAAVEANGGSITDLY